MLVDKAAVRLYRKTTLNVAFNGLVRTVYGTHVYDATIRYSVSRFLASSKHKFQKPKLLLNPTAELYPWSVILFPNNLHTRKKVPLNTCMK
jgi:hypothetical protein